MLGGMEVDEPQDAATLDQKANRTGRTNSPVSATLKREIFCVQGASIPPAEVSRELLDVFEVNSP